MNQYKELKGYRQIFFAVGHMGPGALNQFLTIWLLLFLSTGDDALLSASLVGLALLIGGVIDAVADPLVANWSDRFITSRFGRRLPFIIGGTLPMIISFNMLWYTPYIGSSIAIRFIWVLASLKIFYFTYTLVVNPYFALLPEIAPLKKQRMFIQSFVALFGILGMGFALGGSGFLISGFGFAGAGLLMSLFCAIVMVGPLLTVKKNPQAPVIAIEKTSSNILTTLKSAFSNRSFRTYISGFSIFFLGFQLIQYNLAFLTTILLGLDPGMSSIFFISSVVSAVFLIPIYNQILKRLSTINALKLAVLSFVIVALMIALMPFVEGWIDSRIAGFALMVLLGFPYSGLMVIPNILMSEIIDEDIRDNGIQREALFFGVQGLVNKFMVSIAAFLTGLILDIFGNTAENPLGVLLNAPLAALIALIGYLIMTRMTLSTEK